MKPIDTQADDISRNISENHQQISEEKEHSLSIKADEVAWISLQFGNGKSEEILFHPGESKKWKFEDSILLKIGNIGGIKLNLDGEDLSIYGKSGEVMTLSLPRNE
jgi:cytoskeleton protein RodZ